MSLYRDDVTGQIQDIANNGWNNDLLQGKTLVQDGSPGDMTYPSNGSINSSTLQGGSSPSFGSPSPTTPYDISGLNNYYTPPMTLTPEETRANSLSGILEGLYNKNTGQSAYKKSQQDINGVSDLQTTQADLTAQLQGYQNQSRALQNAAAYTIPNQIQQNAEGRGVTAGGVAPIQAGELRKNQIQQGGIASQALIASASLDAINGKLAIANQKVSDAVSQKYDPIEEQINAATKNLQLILNSPQYDLETKNRAQAQLDLQQKQKDQIAEQKTNETNVLNIGLKAAENHASALVLQQIKNAKTPWEALNIAQNAGVYIKPDTTFAQGSLEEFKYLNGRDPKNTAELNAFTASRSAAGRAPVTSGDPNKPLTVGDLNYYNDQLSTLGKATKIPFGSTRAQADKILADAQGTTSAGGKNWFQDAYNYIFNPTYHAPGGTSTTTPAVNNSTRSGQAFNYQAAKDAGYSDQEIQDYINSH